MSIARSLSACALVVLPLVAPGCASQSKFDDINVQAEANPEVDFAGYDSYAWAAAIAGIRDPDQEWTAPEMNLGAEIMHLVNTELRSRSMTEVVASPDLLVIYGVGVDMKALELVTDDEDGTGRFKEVPMGGLMIALADPDTRRVVWVASASAELHEGISLEDRKLRLATAISRMFKEMPR